MNIIPFPNNLDPVTVSPILPSLQVGEKHTTANRITYSFQPELKASVSPDTIIDYFQSMVDYNLMLPKNTHGFAYFEELLHTLSYAVYKSKSNNIFLLPETTLTYIHKQTPKLNIFECKNIIVQIDRILSGLDSTPQLKSCYNYIRSVLFTRFQKLKKTSQHK